MIPWIQFCTAHEWFMWLQLSTVSLTTLKKFKMLRKKRMHKTQHTHGFGCCTNTIAFCHIFFSSSHFKIVYTLLLCVWTEVSLRIDFKLKFQWKKEPHNDLEFLFSQFRLALNWWRKMEFYISIKLRLKTDAETCDTKLVYVFKKQCLHCKFYSKDNTIIADWIILIVNFCYCASPINNWRANIIYIILWKCSAQHTLLSDIISNSFFLSNRSNKRYKSKWVNQQIVFVIAVHFQQNV